MAFFACTFGAVFTKVIVLAADWFSVNEEPPESPAPDAIVMVGLFAPTFGEVFVIVSSSLA